MSAYPSAREPRQLRTRKPTGIPPYPLILIEGGEKSGKTWSALQFSGDDRIGSCWALDLGEGTLDEYGAIPGARFSIIDHDGTWLDIIGQLEAASAQARVELDAGERVPLLVIDTATAEWEMLKLWVDARARRTDSNKAKLARDPDAEIKAPRNFWNDADARHAKFMRLLMSFPGIVIVTARGKVISATDDKGQPIQGKKDYRVEGHKNLAYDATAWVRMSREEAPIVVGLRSVAHGIRPGIDEVKPWPDFSLGELVFRVIGCPVAGGSTRQIQKLDADQVMPGEDPNHDARQLLAAAKDATTEEQVRSIWADARDSRLLDHLVDGEALRALLTEEANRVRVTAQQDRAAEGESSKNEPQQDPGAKQGGSTAAQRGDINNGLDTLGLTDDGVRGLVVRKLSGRDVARMYDLTYQEAAKVVAALLEYVAQGEAGRKNLLAAVHSAVNGQQADQQRNVA